MNRTTSTALDGLTAPIEEDLSRVEERLQAELTSEHPFLRTLLEHSAKFQGKRIRPAVLLYSAKVFGGVRDPHIALSTVVEMIHSATLFHDDVLDGAERRRRVETLNALWGNEASVLFGDYLFAKAFVLCARLDLCEANVVLAEATRNVCIGELTQISTRFRPELEEDRYLEIIRLKTASLFAAAGRLGAVGAEADPRDIDAVAEFGLHLGTAFQIVDDCLDLVGDEREVGKSLGTDLDKGKPTLPVILLLRALPDRTRGEVLRLLSSPDVAGERRRTIRLLVQEHGAVESSLRKAREFTDRACASLDRLGDANGVEPLRALARSAVSRTR